MKIILFLFLFLLLNCASSNEVYMCGEYICKNKKEFNEFFKQNISVEVFNPKTKQKNEIDLVSENLNNKKSPQSKKSKIFDIITAKKEERKIKKAAIKRRNLEKEKIKKIKKNKIKQVKVIKKQNNNEKKLNSIKKKNIIKKNTISRCPIIEDCDIDQVSDEILKTSREKDFPNITVR